MGALEQLQANRAARALSLSKGYNDNDIEKAHQVGDTKVGKDGITRVWKQLPSGKYDWRKVKTSKPDGVKEEPKVAKKETEVAKKETDTKPTPTTTAKKKQIPDFSPKIPKEIMGLTNRSDYATIETALKRVGEDIFNTQYKDVKDFINKNYVNGNIPDAEGIKADIAKHKFRLGAKQIGYDYKASKTSIIENMKKYYESAAKQAERDWREGENKRYWETVGAGRKKEIESRQSRIKELDAKNLDAFSKTVISALGLGSMPGVNVKCSANSYGQVVNFSLPGSSYDDITWRRDKSWGRDGGFETKVSMSSSSVNMDDPDEVKKMLMRGQIVAAIAANGDKLSRIAERASSIKDRLVDEYRGLDKELTTDHSEQDF